MNRLEQLQSSSCWPVYQRAHVRVLEQALQKRSAAPLMQRAGSVAAQLALAIAPHARHIWIAAGPGNNGGDGLETALNLHQWGKNVLVSLLAEPEQLPADARRAWQRAIHAGVKIQRDLPHELLTTLNAADLCIDALLGLGASRPLSPTMSAWIEALNQTPAKCLALDLPSGLHPDSGQLLNPPETAQQVVRADHTLTFIVTKPGLHMGHGRDASGQLWLADLNAQNDNAAVATPPNPQPDAWLNPPLASRLKTHASHKGTHGDVAVVGGEALQHRGMGMTGAALLAAQAALHAGAGRVMLTLLGESACNPSPPDLMVRHWAQLELENLHVVAGCGGGHAIEPYMPELLLRSAHLVLDADGLNAVAANPTLKQQLQQRATRGQNTVITPHPLEAARLLQSTTLKVQANRLEAAATLAELYQCTVVLKGSGTVITAPKHTARINTSGNGKLAIGGTGDVLAGLIGALMANGRIAFEAACHGVQRHGQVADEWPENLTLTASRLAQRLR